MFLLLEHQIDSRITAPLPSAEVSGPPPRSGVWLLLMSHYRLIFTAGSAVGRHQVLVTGTHDFPDGGTPLGGPAAPVTFECKGARGGISEYGRAVLKVVLLVPACGGIEVAGSGLVGQSRLGDPLGAQVVAEWEPRSFRTGFHLR
jgi:hypothetical protein